MCVAGSGPVRHRYGGHVVGRGQGCNHFLETDFSGFSTDPRTAVRHHARRLFPTLSAGIYASRWPLHPPRSLSLRSIRGVSRRVLSFTTGSSHGDDALGTFDFALRTRFNPLLRDYGVLQEFIGRQSAVGLTGRDCSERAVILIEILL